jgi:hypothetical protein
MDWLVASLVLSLVLTVVLNLGLRLFPHVRDQAERKIDYVASAHREDASRPRVRVLVPWKAIIVGSLVLTIVLILLLWRS